MSLYYDSKNEFEEDFNCVHSNVVFLIGMALEGKEQPMSVETHWQLYTVQPLTVYRNSTNEFSYNHNMKNVCIFRSPTLCGGYYVEGYTIPYNSFQYSLLATHIEDLWERKARAMASVSRFSMIFLGCADRTTFENLMANNILSEQFKKVFTKEMYISLIRDYQDSNFEKIDSTDQPILWHGPKSMLDKDGGRTYVYSGLYKIYTDKEGRIDEINKLQNKEDAEAQQKQLTIF